ncbi:Pycsar system effector family protein [Allomuricauda sp. d1]|uniref:Pycsar system effector family protein n=1 Tax=Allomuricauda sp. d1 TaxID=3136725 RepID=UPI0031D7ABBF
MKHKQETIQHTEELLEASDLNAEQQELVLVAVWFLDTGYLTDYANWKSIDISNATTFLEQEKIASKKVGTIQNLISLVHKLDVPKNKVEKAALDSYYWHLAKSDYVEWSELQKEEINAHVGELPTAQEWRKKSIKFFQIEHRYYTDYALEKWEPEKQKNLKKLLKRKRKAKRTERKERLKAKYKNRIPDRGVQTLYRVTLRNHIKLSDIADTKANILLSVNAIIISLSLANLVPKLDNPSNDYLIYPTAIFVIFCIISMVMSIMATRPNVTSGEFTKEDVKKKRVNLLFFGNFHKMKVENYEWAMMELIKDHDYIYSSLTKDLHALGVVLERKYKLLRWTYTVFMIGMILSVIVFGVALKFYGPDRMLEVPDLPQ